LPVYSVKLHPENILIKITFRLVHFDWTIVCYSFLMYVGSR